MPYRTSLSRRAEDAWQLGPSDLVKVSAPTVNGTAGDDVRYGNRRPQNFDMRAGGNDTVYGMEGRDRFLFGATFNAGDHVDGGSDSDELELEGVIANLTITDAMLTAVERIELHARGDSRIAIVGDLRPDLTSYGLYVAVGAETDAIDVAVDASLSAQRMVFIGGRSSDAMIGGASNDEFIWYHGGRDLFNGGAGYDFFTLSGGSIEGLDGAHLDLRRSDTQLLETGSITLRNVEGIGGSRGADLLIGSREANRIETNGGNDTVRALAGNDLVSFSFNSGLSPDSPTRSVLDGGAGFDILALTAFEGFTISLATADFQRTGMGRYSIRGFEGISGSYGKDTITGSSREDQLFGNNGDDSLSGAAGDDLLFGDARVKWELGPDTRWIIERDQSFLSGRDTLDGGAGNDRLHGEAGDDRLTGGVGADELWGGIGNDRFLYADARESRGLGRDTIMDFAAGDRIDLSAIDADPIRAGDQTFHLGTTPDRAGDITFFYEASIDRTVIALYLDGDSSSDMSIWLKGEVTLSAADFVL